MVGRCEATHYCSQILRSLWPGCQTHDESDPTDRLSVGFLAQAAPGPFRDGHYTLTSLSWWIFTGTRCAGEVRSCVEPRVANERYVQMLLQQDISAVIV